MDITALACPGHGVGADHEITGICCVKKGNDVYTVFSSWFEKTLGILNKDLVLRGGKSLDDKAYSLCEMPSSGEFAATFRDLKVLHCFTVGDGNTLAKTRSFSVPKSCRGIKWIQGTFADNFVIVSGGTGRHDTAPGLISIYTIASDRILPTLVVPAKLGTQELQVRNLTVNKAKSLVYMTDVNIGVLVMNREGKISLLIDAVANPIVKGTRGLCLDEEADVLYVAGTLSNNIVKYKSDGTLIGEIANESLGIFRPGVLFLDRERRYLWVGCRSKSTNKLLYIEL